MDIPNLSPLSEPQPNSKKVFIPLLLIAVSAGIASGFWLSRLFPSSGSSSAPLFVSGESQPISPDKITSRQQISVGAVYGIKNGNFKDTATGVIKSGGINGEGTHTLDRPGGDAQNAALTSSVLDLDLFVDRRVEVRGETNASLKSGWFMDVGSIKVLE